VLVLETLYISNLPAPEDTTAQQQVQQHMQSTLFWYWSNIMVSILGRNQITVKRACRRDAAIRW